jgi:succinyl-CoA synthetase alpha subunit
MGHAAALIGSKAEGHAAKQKLLSDAGVFVAAGLAQVVASMQHALASGMKTAAAA